MSNAKYPYVLTGPEHLNEAARLAELALTERETSPVDAAIWANVACAHASIAQALAFGALAASEGGEFTAPWAALMDPDGSIAAEETTRREAEAARRETGWAAEEARREADHQRRMSELNALSAREPIDLYPTSPSGPPAAAAYNVGPLVTPVSSAAISAAAEDLARSLIEDE